VIVVTLSVLLFFIFLPLVQRRDPSGRNTLTLLAHWFRPQKGKLFENLKIVEKKAGLVWKWPKSICLSEI